MKNQLPKHEVRVLCCQLQCSASVKEFLDFCGTWSFIIVFICAIFWARLIQSATSYPIPLRSIIFWEVSFLWEFWLKFCVQSSCLPRLQHVSYLILLYFITITTFGEQHKLWSSSVCNVLPPTTWDQIFHSPPSSQTVSIYLNLCSSLTARN
jgi:hypothetical protein